MGAHLARWIEEPAYEAGEGTAGLATPQEYRSAVSAALNESIRFAQRIAAEGHARFPDDPELERLSRLLILPPARSIPSNGRKQVSHEKAFRWLDENAALHRGEWVALDGEGFLTAAPTLAELMKKIEPIDPENPPLVHHIH